MKFSNVRKSEIVFGICNALLTNICAFYVNPFRDIGVIGIILVDIVAVIVCSARCASYTVIDDSGITAKSIGEEYHFAWRDIRFVAKYHIKNIFKREGLIFSLKDEEHLKGHISYDDLKLESMKGFSAREDYYVCRLSEKAIKAINEYGRNKLIEREFDSEDFGF